MFKKTIALIGTPLLFVILLNTGVATAEMKQGEMMVDKAKLLKDKGVFGTFAIYRLDASWNMLDEMTKARAVEELKKVFKKHEDKVAVDTYLTRGLTEGADLFLRIHSYHLINNQNFLLDLRSTTMGKHLIQTDVFVGITKKLNYADKDPGLLMRLKAGKLEPGPKKYAIVIPIKKDAEWWNLPFDVRVGMMREHTMPTLKYLTTVKRKLYHSTGLDDLDFVTYFETNKLDQFNNLVLSLLSVRENLHNERHGSPVVLGTIRSLDEVLEILAK